jgi:uncharacterized protein with HEPN domain
MSEASQPREWRFYINDMVAFCEKVERFTLGLDQAGFLKDTMRFDATIRNVELIGEAATHIPANVREAYSRVPWRMIIATRNQLIHGYLGIDNDTLWSIVQTDIPSLLQELQRIKESSI